MSVTSPRRARALYGVVAVVALGALGLQQQARIARRRYRKGLPAPGLIDLLITPEDAEPMGGRPLELAAFGDSGMAGVGADSIEGTLPVQLAQRLADATGRCVHVWSSARSGARTADVLAEQLPRLCGKPDAVVLMVGTNDLTHVTPWRHMQTGTDRLLDALTAVGAPVIMSGLPEIRALRAVPRPLQDIAMVRAAGLRRLQRGAVRRRPGMTLIDVRAIVGTTFVQRVDTMSLDVFHPSAVGYGLIADALLPAILAGVGSTRASTGHQHEPTARSAFVQRPILVRTR